MVKLAILQHDFLKEMFAVQSEKTPTYIRRDARLAAVRQFEIYQTSIHSRLQRTLQRIYPVCEKVVGADFFSTMTYSYLCAEPSIFKDLNQYGRTFGNFIASFSPAQSLPYLASLAELEWALYRASNVRQTSKFDFVQFAQYAESDAENIQLCLPQGASLLAADFATKTIWEMHQVADLDNLQTLTLLQQQTFYIVSQKESGVQIEELSETDYTLLKLIESGHSFAALCETIDFTQHIGRYLQLSWIANWKFIFSP